MANGNPTLKGRFMMALARYLPLLESLPVQSSHLIGPFENYDLVGWFASYPPENDPGAQIDMQAWYPGKTGEVQWQRVVALDGLHEQMVIISAPENAVTHSVAYFSAEVLAPSQLGALLGIECSGMVQAW